MLDTIKTAVKKKCQCVVHREREKVSRSQNVLHLPLVSYSKQGGRLIFKPVKLSAKDFSFRRPPTPFSLPPDSLICVNLVSVTLYVFLCP